MRVGLVVTCLVDLMRPGIGWAAVDLLERAGADVVVPRTQTCCGQPAWNGGDRRGAAVLARKLVAEYEEFDWIVAPSGSCAGMIRIHYPTLLADDPAWSARARAVAAKTRELTQFLVDVLGVDAVPGRYEGKVTYHDCCAGLRELGVKTQPRALLAKVDGLEFAEMAEPESCCGFGGTFSLKFGEIAAHIADRKCAQVVSSGASAVVMGDLGCMLNVEGRLRRRGDESTRVLHVAEVLAGRVG